MGNRDLNKLRIWSELSDQDMERPVEEIEKPFWDRGAKSLKEYLEEIRDKHAKNGEDESTSNLDKWNTKAERLRYMLKHTLGCPDTFEFRREEIKILRTMYGCYPSNSHRNANTPVHTTNTPDYIDSIEVTDEEVVESFQYEINHTDGSLRQYLKHASIAAVVGNTIFVHGAIDALTMKFVPSLESKFHLPKSSPPSFTAISSVTTSVEDGTIIDNVHDWVQALNEFLQHGLKDFELRPDWNEERSSRGGEALLAIQNRPSMWGRSVVCNSYGDGGVIATVDSEEERKQALRMAEEQNYPLAFEGIASSVFDPEPAKWLLDHGIQRIVVGHKPTGDCPAVLSSRYTGKKIFILDRHFVLLDRPFLLLTLKDIF